jgi:UDP-N-acetylglucosamine transferase subunit ALG13
MILVTLGTIPFPFDRAIDWIAFLLENGTISEPVFVQYGVSNVAPIMKHRLVTAESIVQSKDLMKIVDASRLVISHAGQGSTRSLAERGARFVLLPRLASHCEHIDDHQLLFAKSVERLGVLSCLSLNDLQQSVLQPPPPFQGQLFEGPRLAEHLLKAYPSNLVKQPLLKRDLV